jgi:hypothetical protein
MRRIGSTSQEFMRFQELSTVNITRGYNGGNEQNGYGKTNLPIDLQIMMCGSNASSYESI